MGSGDSHLIWGARCDRLRDPNNIETKGQ